MPKKITSYTDYPELQMSIMDWNITSVHDIELIKKHELGSMLYDDNSVKSRFIFKFENLKDSKKRLNRKVVDTALKDHDIRSKLTEHMIGYIVTENIDESLPWSDCKEGHLRFCISGKMLVVYIKRDSVNNFSNVENKLLTLDRWINYVPL